MPNKKTQISVAIDAEQVLDKIQHLFLGEKKPQKIGIKLFLTFVHGIYKNSTAKSFMEQ